MQEANTAAVCGLHPRRALQRQYDAWHFGYGAYGSPWGPRFGLGWGYGSHYDPFFNTWRRRW